MDLRLMVQGKYQVRIAVRGVVRAINIAGVYFFIVDVSCKYVSVFIICACAVLTYAYIIFFYGGGHSPDVCGFCKPPHTSL